MNDTLFIACMLLVILICVIDNIRTRRTMRRQIVRLVRLTAPTNKNLEDWQVIDVREPVEGDTIFCLNDCAILSIREKYRWSDPNMRYIVTKREKPLHNCTSARVSSTEENTQNIPKPQSSGDSQENEMNKYVATIIARLTNINGVITQPKIVKTLEPILAPDPDRARTLITAAIAQDEAVKHVLDNPDSYEIQVVHNAPILKF